MRKDQVSAGFLSVVVEGVKAKEPPPGMSTSIIAIDGPGGAGKSTLAKLLSGRLGRAPVLHTDDFASWDDPLNWWPRLVADVLEPLARNETARYRRTDWGNKDHEEWGEVAPSEFLILEGVGASREAFRPFLTYSIWVDVPRSLRLRRGLKRDGQEARGQWEKWMSEEDDYIERERPQEWVDLVLPGDQNLWR
jgi:uridine kinase